MNDLNSSVAAFYTMSVFRLEELEEYSPELYDSLVQGYGDDLERRLHDLKGSSSDQLGDAKDALDAFVASIRSQDLAKQIKICEGQRKIKDMLDSLAKI